MHASKLRVPVLIGIAAIGAGILVYESHSQIDPRQTQGAIGQRSVYREGEVKAADVNAKPGSAPVALKAVMESKEFKALAKNAAFQGLLANQGFQALAQNSQLFALLQNPAFLQMAANSQFNSLLQNGSMQQLILQLQTQNLAGADLTKSDAFRSDLAAYNAQSLASNPAFAALVQNLNFQALVANQGSSQALHNMLTFQGFASLAQNSLFQSLISQSSFQTAMMAGSAAGLSSQLVIQ